MELSRIVTTGLRTKSVFLRAADEGVNYEIEVTGVPADCSDMEAYEFAAATTSDAEIIATGVLVDDTPTIEERLQAAEDALMAILLGGV